MENESHAFFDQSLTNSTNRSSLSTRSAGNIAASPAIIWSNSSDGALPHRPAADFLEDVYVASLADDRWDVTSLGAANSRASSGSENVASPQRPAATALNGG